MIETKPTDGCLFDDQVKAVLRSFFVFNPQSAARNPQFDNSQTANRNSDGGFTLPELLAVIFIALILAALAIFNFAAVRRNVKTNTAANTMFSLMQQARQRAITNRAMHRVTITRSADPSNGRINSVVISDSANNVIRQEYLPQDVLIGRGPDTLMVGSPRAIPDEAAFDAPLPGGSFTFIFNVDGTVTDALGNPLTGSIFFSDNPLGKRPTLTRALSVFSSTGDVKYWYYDGSKFVSGIRNN